LYDENRGYCHDSVKCNVLNDAGNPTLVIDVVSDVVCPDYHSGRLGVDDCSAYVDCVNGFEVGRERCDEGTMYSTSTENCERDVTECSSIVSMGDAVKEGNGCGEDNALLPMENVRSLRHVSLIHASLSPATIMRYAKHRTVVAAMQYAHYSSMSPLSSLTIAECTCPRRMTGALWLRVVTYQN